MAGALGIEPRLIVLETIVLPLHHTPMCLDTNTLGIEKYECDVERKFFFLTLEIVSVNKYTKIIYGI